MAYPAFRKGSYPQHIPRLGRLSGPAGPGRRPRTAACAPLFPACRACGSGPRLPESITDSNLRQKTARKSVRDCRNVPRPSPRDAVRSPRAASRQTPRPGGAGVPRAVYGSRPGCPSNRGRTARRRMGRPFAPCRTGRGSYRRGGPRGGPGRTRSHTRPTLRGHSPAGYRHRSPAEQTAVSRSPRRRGL